ncbi:MAG: PASTA domain-containing protein [Acidobacteriota bacterium]|nr:PASTA domain-containing protein [Acidobacteriota bacterium]
MAKRSFVHRVLFWTFLAGVSGLFLILGGAAATWITIKSQIQGKVVEVPFLFNLSEKEARQTIAGLNLTLLVNEEAVPDNIVEKGKILLQVPREGEKIKAGRSVHVTLSSGPAVKTIPQLEGETLSFARTLLKEVDTDAKIISRIPFKGRTKGRVLSQWPKDGEEIGLRQGASLLVADGEPMPFYVMPDLTGKDYLGVKAFLDKVGLRHVAKYKTEDEDLGQLVLGQTPKAGYPVNRAKTITLTVNKDF